MKANQITNIKKDKKNYKLYINNKDYVIDSYYYECLLPYIGKVLDVSLMLEVIAFSSATIILNKLYKKIFNNQLSVFEIKEKLKKAELNEEQIKIIINRLKEEGLLDDYKFAMHYKEIYEIKKGVNAFKTFLISKHVSSYVIDKCLQDYNENNDYALEYANKFINSKVNSTVMLKQALKANLINKGFSKETINYVFDNISFKDENENLKIHLKKYYQKYPQDNYKIISKLANKGYNINEIKKVMKEEGMFYED